MRITRLEFSEFDDEPRSWSLDATDISQITLLVGKNSSGKTRCLNVIVGLAKLFIGEVKPMFNSGYYKVHFAERLTTYEYELDIVNSEVVKETLSRNGSTLLARRNGGVGLILAEKLKQTIEFQAPTNVVAVYVKRDQLQHSFLQALYDWASNVRHYQFGTSFGRDHVVQVDEMQANRKYLLGDPRKGYAAYVYRDAFEAFREEFDKAVIADMQSLGYSLEGVELSPIDIPNVSGTTFVGLSVKETDLNTKTSQLFMSAGMFRALALVICINDCTFRKQHLTLLIDDVGEGLDYARSCALVELLVERARAHEFQLLFTSNDRFVMNKVPLEYWGVISRSGGRVSVANRINSAESFKQFESLGLNNFDFFTTNFANEGLEKQ